MRAVITSAPWLCHSYPYTASQLRRRSTSKGVFRHKLNGLDLLELQLVFFSFFFCSTEHVYADEIHITNKYQIETFTEHGSFSKSQKLIRNSICSHA